MVSSAFFRYVCDMVLLINMLVIINLNGKDAFKTDWLGWIDLAWQGLAWLGLAWLGFAWLGLAWLGRISLTWFGMAWLGVA